MPIPTTTPSSLAEDGKRSRRSKIMLRTIGVLVVAAILGRRRGYAAWAWSQQQFFVAADRRHVALFRGVSQDLGPIRLSHVETMSDVLVSDLPTDVQTSVDNTIPARDLADAEVKIAALRSEAVRCQHLAATGTPCGTSPAPTPVPTTSPTTGSTSPTSPAPTSPTPSPSTSSPRASAAAAPGVVDAADAIPAAALVVDRLVGVAARRPPSSP